MPIYGRAKGKKRCHGCSLTAGYRLTQLYKPTLQLGSAIFAPQLLKLVAVILLKYILN